MSREHGPSGEIEITLEGGESVEQKIERLKEVVITKGDERRVIHNEITELEGHLKEWEKKNQWKAKIEEDASKKEFLIAEEKQKWEEYESVEAELRLAWNELEKLMGFRAFEKWILERGKTKSE